MLGSRRGRGQSCREEWWRGNVDQGLMMGNRKAGTFLTCLMGYTAGFAVIVQGVVMQRSVASVACTHCIILPYMYIQILP